MRFGEKKKNNNNKKRVALSSHLKYTEFVADIFFFFKEEYNRKMFPFAENIQPNNPMCQSQCRLLPSVAGAEASSCLGPERQTHGPASIMDTSHGGTGTAAVTAGA